MRTKAGESPTKARLRVVTRPEPQAEELLSWLGLDLSTAPQRIEK